MSGAGSRFSRRAFVRGAGGAAVGAISARGIYEALDAMGLAAPERAAAATVTRPEEQYLVTGLEKITDNGVEVVIPPIYNDVITAKLAAGVKWSAGTLKSARSRLESALRSVEEGLPPTAGGLTIVVGWGLPYFRRYVKAAWEAYGPMDVALSQATGTQQRAVLDAIKFPSDPTDLVLEDNEVVFKLRSDSQQILKGVESALFENKASTAYLGNLFDFTSNRKGFLGRGFGTTSAGKQLAMKAGVPGAQLIPDNSQLMLGFTSTQPAALGSGNIASFETLPGVSDQRPGTYFAAGCAMHLSHLFLDLERWYNAAKGGFDYSTRVARMFSPHDPVPADSSTVTLPNGPENVSSKEQLLGDAAQGLVGHNETLQQAARLQADTTDNYGKWRAKGTAIPIREDFNTLDNPFAWSAKPEKGIEGASAAAGLHFAVFVPTSNAFHRARAAMDGVLPDGTNLRTEYGITDAQNGINAVMRATHRQNFLVPPRSRRSFPLVEFLR